MRKLIIFLLMLVCLSSIAYATVTHDGTETTNGTYTVVTFTSNGWFNTSTQLTNISVLVVAGGGEGGSYYGGGGGAGGLIYYEENYTLNVDNYQVTVGVGGSGSSSSAHGNDGGNSVFDTITSIGGGGGGDNTDYVGRTGGSAGGNGQVSTGAVGQGTAGQGFNGGQGYGGGGGGAGGAGTSSSGFSPAYGGHGGIGRNISINGSIVCYGGGGGGASDVAQPQGIAICGGGSGATGDNNDGSAGTSNTGGGGGGAGGAASGYDGGSGIVIIRYLNTTLSIPIPQQVENLTSLAITTKTINISWDYNAQTNGGANITVNGSLNGSVLYPQESYLITGLTEGTEYNITVVAVNASGTNTTNTTENNILVTTIDNFIGSEFKGLIDNYNIFGSALTPGEIEVLFSGGFQTPTTNTNMTTSSLVFPTLSFDINVSIFGDWDAAPTCQIVDNVSWLSCSPTTYDMSFASNHTTFTCTSDNSNTGDVSVYSNCTSTTYLLVNSSTVTYTFKNYDSIILGSTLYLPFNNTIQDFSVTLVDTWMETNGIISSPSYGIGHYGISNEALSTTKDDYLRFNSSDIAYAETSTMTFWANAFANYSGNADLVYSKFGKVTYNSSNALLSYGVNNSGTLKTIVYPINLTGGYNFLSVVCDNSTSTMYLYINATLVNSSGSTTCTELQ